MASEALVAKRDRETARAKTSSSLHKITPGFAHLLTPEHKKKVEDFVRGRMTTLVPGAKPSIEMRRLAREILHRSHGVVVSSQMALSTAIIAMRANGDFDEESAELSLMQAVLRYSEQNQVPPSFVMQLIADEEIGPVDEATKPD